MTTENNNIDAAPSWFIDEGIPGIGERPNWLPEKFKTVADLSKSYAELEKRVGIAPESYDFTKSRYLDPDYVPFQELQQFAKEKRVPQDVMDKMIESVDKYMDEFSSDPTEELKKLGDNAKERVTTVDNWAKANLSKESYEALTGSIRNADSIKALEELRGKIMSNNVQVPGNNGSIEGVTSLDDLTKELSMNLTKYKNDDSYRKEYQKRLEIASKNNTTFVDKVGA
jgi:hypothetical protein